MLGESKKIVLRDRLYVPAEYVTEKIMEEFTDQVEIGTHPETKEKMYDIYHHYFYTQVSVDDGFYVFNRGDMGKIRRVFANYEILDQRLSVPMRHKLKMKFQEGYRWRTYQPDAIDALIQNEYGLLKAPPRSGKTVMIAATVCADREKTIVLAHQNDLLEQMLDTFYNFTNLETLQDSTGEKIVGFAKEIEDFMDLDVALCTKQTFDHLNNKLKLSIVQNMFGSLWVDECFSYRTGILTEKGPVHIYQLYKKWLKKEPLPKVLSFNGENFEYKKITYAWEKRPKTKLSLIKVKAARLSFVCTPDHKLLTTVGWVKAKDLCKKHVLVGNYDSDSLRHNCSSVLNTDQEQLLLGGYLGDASISKHGLKHRVKFCHGVAQEKYVKWKEKILRGCTAKKILNNGFSKKPAWVLQSKLFYTDHNFDCPKKNIPRSLLNKIDARGLAVWLMDDGSRSHKGLRLHTENFNYANQKKLVIMYGCTSGRKKRPPGRVRTA